LQKVAVITDSVACLTREQVEKHGISIVPLYINFEGKALRDWVDMTPNEAYELFMKNLTSFTTSAPSPADFLRTYHEASRKTDNIVCITLSSKISSTYNDALLAKEMAAKELPGINIEVIDSWTATSAEGMIVLAAARAADRGDDLKSVIDAALTVKDKVNVLVLLDTIKYVYRSGRVPKVAAQAGSMLNIRPLLNVSGGVNFVSVARNRERGIDHMMQKIKAKVDGKPLHASVMHAYAPEAAEQLKERVSQEFNCVELWLTEFSPVMGYACGTGTLGVAFYTED
jgi:DegV family protein with EDD domain